MDESTSRKDLAITSQAFRPPQRPLLPTLLQDQSVALTFSRRPPGQPATFLLSATSLVERKCSRGSAVIREYSFASLKFRSFHWSRASRNKIRSCEVDTASLAAYLPAWDFFWRGLVLIVVSMEERLSGNLHYLLLRIN